MDTTDQATALSKTTGLIRKDVPINLLFPNENNPNEMSEAEFNMLYDNIESMGITDPILVKPLGDPSKKDCTYRIIGGHHRWEVAKVHGFEEVPVTIVTDPNFDEDQEKFQMVRHNVIHGKMNPKKFMSLYQSLSEQYTDEIAAEMFGFTDEEEFKKLLASTAKALPPEMKQEFKEATKEIRTINELAMVLNRLFTTYGDTVPYGYMILDYGNQDHVWLRLKKKQKDHLIKLGNLCKEHQVTIDEVMASILQLIALGKFTNEDLVQSIAKLPKVDFGMYEEQDINTLPTEDYAGDL